MLDETSQLYMASTQSTENSTPLTFITGLKYDTNVVKALNNITFLYDPSWEYEPMNPTYPIAFFYVKKHTEDMTSEVSQKPMLFYNSEGSSASDSVKAGLLNIVADNIIIKPKVYKLDVIIPMNMNTFFSGGYYNSSHILTANTFALTGKTTDKTLSAVVTIASGVRNILNSLFTALYGTEISVSSICNMMTGQQDYNKNSIEYMWRNRRILKLKMWNGWKFKYLVITNFEVTKEGENGDYYEGSITCQEMPILTIKNSSSLATTFVSKISSILGKGIKTATDTFIKTMETTAGVKTYDN